MWHIPATALLRFRTGIQMQLAQLTVMISLLPTVMLVCARMVWRALVEMEHLLSWPQYSDSACTTKQMDRNMVVECSAFGDPTTPGSQKTSFGDTITLSTYNSSDCTGDAATTNEMGSCGNCTSVPGGVYVMWDRTSTALASPMKLHLLTGMIGFVFLVLNFWEPSLNIWAVTKTLTIRCIKGIVLPRYWFW